MKKEREVKERKRRKKRKVEEALSEGKGNRGKKLGHGDFTSACKIWWLERKKNCCLITGKATLAPSSLYYLFFFLMYLFIYLYGPLFWSVGSSIFLMARGIFRLGHVGSLVTACKLFVMTCGS